MLEALKKRFDIDKFLFIAAIVGFIAYCLTDTLLHDPIFDEVNAWNISAYLNIFEIFDIAKYEGHTVLWYLLIMPFAKLNFAYPYSMEILNWLFAFAAIIVLWKYSPFNSWIKLFITFCTPIKTFSYFARCYSIGIFIIFVICALYPKRLKHPLWYSLLLILLANTSVIGAVIAFSFGVIFCIDLYHGVKSNELSKKDVISSVLICLSGAVILLFQFWGYHTPFYSNKYLGIGFYKQYTRNFWILISSLFVTTMASYFMKKNIQPFIFMFVASFTLLYLFTYRYCGDIWHWQFMYIVLICMMWLYLYDNKLEMVSEKFFVGVFGFMCLALVVSQPILPESIDVAYKDYVINNISLFKDKKIFVIPMEMSMSTIFPNIEKYNLNMYDMYANPVRSADAYRKIWYNDPIDWGAIEKTIAKDKEAYLFVTVKDLMESKHSRNFVFTKQVENIKTDLKITPIAYAYPAMIYKVENPKGVNE